MRVDVYTQKGIKGKSKAELNPAIFGVKPNEDLVAQYVRIYLFNQRGGTSSVKTRGEVRGGGRKPWRQKGTGRARHGSIRSPIWVGGGVAHGPKKKDWSLKMPKKMRRNALFSSLSEKTLKGNIIVVQDLKFEKISTKNSELFIRTLPVGRKVLLVLPSVDENIIKSFLNVSFVTVYQAKDLNAFEVVSHDSIVFLKNSLKVLEDTFFR